MLGEEYNNLEVNTYFLDFQIEWSKSVVDMNKYPTIDGNRYVITYLFKFLHNITNIYISFYVNT